MDIHNMLKSAMLKGGNEIISNRERKKLKAQAKTAGRRQIKEEIAYRLKKQQDERQAALMSRIERNRAAGKVRRDWRAKIGAEHGVRPRRVILTSKIIPGKRPEYLIMK